MAGQLKEELESLLRIPDKHKQLNKFIQASTEAEVEEILAVFAGQDEQSQLVKLLLADKFQRYDIVLDLLRHGRKTIVHKAVKLNWLYNSKSKFLDASYLLDEFFPSVSYSCRLKIINNMGMLMSKKRGRRSGGKGDDIDIDVSSKLDVIFDAIEKKYGFSSAIPLLPSCSKSKLKSVIISKSTKIFNERLVLAILKRCPDLGISILKKHYTTVILDNGSLRGVHYYTSELNFILDNFPIEDFMDLFMQSLDALKNRLYTFSPRRTKKLIQYTKNPTTTTTLSVKSHAPQLSQLFSLNQIQKYYNQDEFQLLFQASLPKDIDDALTTVHEDIWKWLKPKPRSQKLEMLTRAFQQKYEVNILDDYQLMTPAIISLLPTEEERLKVVEWKILNDKDYSFRYEDFSIYYYSSHGDQERTWAWIAMKPIEKSIPELKQLYVTEADCTNRCKLAKCMILSCLVNKNLAELLIVLNFLSKRSRNDQPELRSDIFQSLSLIIEKLELQKEHWDVILEMIQVSLLYKNGTSSSEQELLENCLAFYLKCNLPLENVVGMLIKVKTQLNVTI